MPVVQELQAARQSAAPAQLRGLQGSHTVSVNRPKACCISSLGMMSPDLVLEKAQTLPRSSWQIHVPPHAQSPHPHSQWGLHGTFPGGDPLQGSCSMCRCLLVSRGWSK